MQVWDLAGMLGMEAGDEMEFDYLGEGVLRIKTLRWKERMEE